jgi:hypothetical protein
MNLSIQSVKCCNDYKVKLKFNDGADKIIDFQPFLNQSQHPSIRAFLEPAKFKNFRIEHGDLVWGDYDLCFPIADLYYDRIDRSLTA